jgi:integrase
MSTKPDWRSTATQHLIQHIPSGNFYVRVKVRGKIVRQSLKTKKISVAKARLPEKLKEIRYCLDAPVTANVETMGDCLDLVVDAAKHKTGLRARSRDYREFTVDRIRATWPELSSLKPKDVPARDCDAWFRRISTNYSASLANNMLGSLRMAFEFAQKSGLIFRDPSEDVKRARTQPKHLILPDAKTFKKFALAIRKAKNAKKPSWHSAACADLVEFLAYSGARLNEAKNILWKDVDEKRGMILLRETKGGAKRWVPIIPAMKDLLTRLPKKGERVLRVGEAEKSMTRAAREIEMDRITHHDLRHLFATACIESGVDIPTVARWLGHKDGGVLALKTYGHLREAHSAGAAKKVVF